MIGDDVLLAVIEQEEAAKILQQILLSLLPSKLLMPWLPDSMVGEEGVMVMTSASKRLIDCGTLFWFLV